MGPSAEQKTSSPGSADTAPPIFSGAKGRNTRTQILEAALKIASREGLGGLTIGELAKTVGMSKSGLFAHFKGKDSLQLAVLEAAVERFVESVMQPAFAKPRGLARLNSLIDNWIAFINGSANLPGGSVLISASVELDDRPGRLRDFVQKAQRDLITNIEKAARIAVQESQFRSDLDCEQFAWSLYAFVLGYHHSARMLEDPKAELHFRRSMRGLFKVAEQNVELETSPKKMPEMKLKVQKLKTEASNKRLKRSKLLKRRPQKKGRG